MAINSYITEKSGKPSSDKPIALVMLTLWLLNNIALCVFGILSEWLSLAKWEIWATYAAAFLIGLVVWLISKQEALKEDRNLVLISLLFLAALIIAAISLVALFTGRY